MKTLSMFKGKLMSHQLYRPIT